MRSSDGRLRIALAFLAALVRLARDSSGSAFLRRSARRCRRRRRVPSPALISLRESRLAEVRALLSLRPKRAPGNAVSVAAADAVNRASVVVLVAHLEGFVEDLIDDAIDALNS